MSIDEARYTFTLDAPSTTDTNFYLLVGDNSYNYSFAGSDLSFGIVGDLDAFAMHLNPGMSYTVIASQTALASPVVSDVDFRIADRYGTSLSSSTDYGSFSGYSFTATDTLYYLQVYTGSAGYYTLRLGNNSIAENNSIGQSIETNNVYSSALDYASDVDIYTFFARAGEVYKFTVSSTIPDLYLDLEYNQAGVSSVVANGAGVYTFAAPATGSYQLHLSSNSFFSTGQYSFVVEPIDVVAPTVLNFSPTDEAAGVSPAADIVVTFSEQVQRGTGSIVLKTLAGSVIAAYDAATSPNLSVSGSTLTINPSAKLAYSTGYNVEFAAGSLQDLAGNSYAGTTSYNFTTAAPVQELTFIQTLQDDKLLEQVFSNGSTPSNTLSGAFTYTSSNLVFDNLTFPSSASLSLSASSFGSSGSVTFSASATAPNSALLPIATLTFTGNGSGLIDLNFSTLRLNGTTPIYADPTPYSYGIGGSENTLFTSTPRDDHFDGGGGIDTAVFTAAPTQYTIDRHSETWVTVRGEDSVDELFNVERLVLGASQIAIDISGNAGMAYRLYKAAFDRVPDLPGLGYQMHDLDSGVSLGQVASNFIASPEFQATYGAVSNEQFVTLLYWNVLDRAPELEGLQYHVSRLAAGAIRADILVGFSESPENKANVIGLIEQGMEYVW